MNRFRMTLVAVATVAISLCVVFGLLALSARAGPVLLKFAAEHPVVLQGGTLLLLLVAISAMLLVKKRSKA